MSVMNRLYVLWVSKALVSCLEHNCEAVIANEPMLGSNRKTEHCLNKVHHHSFLLKLEPRPSILQISSSFSSLASDRPWPSLFAGIDEVLRKRANLVNYDPSFD